MNAIVNIILITISTSLIGCGTPLTRDYKFPPEHKEGLLVVSTSNPSNCGFANAMQWLSFDPTDGTYMGTHITIQNVLTKQEFEDASLQKEFDDERGYFWVYRLPAKEYAINYPWAPHHIFPRDGGFNIPFTVKPDKINYIGSMQVNVNCDDGKMRVEIAMRDHQVRDLDLLKKRFDIYSPDVLNVNILKIDSKAGKALSSEK